MMLLLLANWGWRFAIVDALGKEHVQADNMVTNKQSAIVSFGKIGTWKRRLEDSVILAT
ncbi:hypothetical protein ACOSQ2_016826 [Xanthoceras sorbifolium]